MSGTFDVAVIGAGVVGCAVFRAFVLAGARTVLLDAAADILEGASKANTAILHTGFDATPDTLEVACVRSGYRLYQEVRERLHLPILRSGAVVVAWTEADVLRLPEILDTARRNGVEARAVDAAALRALEPGLAEGALGGVLVPGESVIDPWSAPLAYARQGLANGGTIRLGARVAAGALQGGAWRLEVAGAEREAVAARVVVNCAGLQGDIVEAIARPSPFEICPRKGQIVVFDKTAHTLIERIILPVPTAITKGVVLCRTIFGNLLVGPTAEEQSDRETAALEEATLRALVAQGRRMLPALAHEAPIAAYAGLRPATRFKEYRIEALAERRWICVGGIRSTGLTGALGIAAHVLALHAESFAAEAGTWRPPEAPVWPRVPNLAEAAPRAWQAPGRSDIVCHCEMVTADEIEAATSGPLAAGTLGGLRRRSRAMNGRCQGFYCSRRVMQIVRGRIPGLVEMLPERADRSVA